MTIRTEANLDKNSPSNCGGADKLRITLCNGNNQLAKYVNAVDNSAVLT